MMEKEAGFGSQQTGVRFLLFDHSFFHECPCSASSVEGMFSVRGKNNSLFGQALVAWLPTQPVPN